MIKDLSIETALKIAEEIKDRENYKSALSIIADYLAKAGEHEKALNLVKNSFDTISVQDVIIELS